MPDLSFLDDMIDKTIEYKKKNDLIPICFVIPGYGFGCIDIKSKEVGKDVIEVEINGVPVILLGKNHPKNPLNMKGV